MRFRGRIGNGLAVLSGARPDVLEAAPGARPKFVALGGVLLSTGGLAVVSAAFAVHMALGVWWPFALVIGLGWGAVVVNLDRMLLVGMAHDASLKRNLALAVPRVGLALVLGVRALEVEDDRYPFLELVGDLLCVVEASREH